MPAGMNLPMINRKQIGMSLIELMIAVAIVSILAGIAYPSYTQHVIDTRRKLAQSCLSEYALYMERFYTMNMTYEGASLAVGECVSNLNSGGASYYSFTLSTESTDDAPSSFMLTATPIGAQDSADRKCGVALTLNQSGKRDTDPFGHAAKCW